MTFLDAIFRRLQDQVNTSVLREIRGGEFVSVTGGELLRLVARARGFVRALDMKKGERCALLAANSIRWIALDLALMAEGLIVVPLYSRQSPVELAGMMKDSTPSAIFSSDEALAAEIRNQWPDGPQITALDGVFADEGISDARTYAHLDSDAVAIVYTSGTSGEPKGVTLNGGNINHILGCTNARLDLLMSGSHQPDRVFHYTPFCFAASWIAMLTFLSRNSVLTLSTDLTKLSEELKLASPDYFLNVPTLLERVRAKITETIQKRGGWTAAMFGRAQRALLKSEQSELLDRLCLSIARVTIFPKIRKNIGPNLKALICGSAPLAVETQLFFMTLGISVLQVYGLTETTAICTMDDPRDFEPGRVGPAIPGIEMKVAENGEILVRGPNIFPGYWRRPSETAKALEGGWFHTGDQGDVDAKGRWRVTGRLKNLLVLNSGHKIAPEPLEETLSALLPEAQQLILVGTARSHLALLVASASANGLDTERIRAAVDAINATLPHYKHIRGFHVVHEPFSIENGLLTANGKIKRDAVGARFSAEIEQLYQRKPA